MTRKLKANHHVHVFTTTKPSGTVIFGKIKPGTVTSIAADGAPVIAVGSTTYGTASVGVPKWDHKKPFSVQPVCYTPY